jgi:hypothetical protein
MTTTTTTTNYEAPPPKKTRTGLKIFLGVIAFGFIALVGMIVLVGTAANEVSKSIEAEQANDKPFVVTEGKAFEHDGYRVAAGWKITSEKYTGLTITGLKVTNVDHSTATDDSPMLTFSLWKGNQNLVEIEASGNALAKGQSTMMDSYSLSETQKVPAYDAIKVKDMW